MNPELNAQHPLPTSPTKPSHDQVAELAHQLWKDNGCREGHATEDWLRAEEMLMQQLPVPPAARRPKEMANSADSNASEARPLSRRDHPMARDERGSASRDEIRASSGNPPSARQSGRMR